MDFFDENYEIVQQGSDCPYHPGMKLGKHKYTSGKGESKVMEPTICHYQDEDEGFTHTHTKDSKGLTLTPRSTDGLPEYSVRKG